jgi:hypothetical protein
MMATGGQGQTGDEPTVFVDKGDWPAAAVCLVLLVIHTVGLAILWQEPRDVAPLYFLIPFTGVFLIATPFLIKQVLVARTRRVELCPGERQFVITERSLFTKRVRHESLDHMVAVVFETTDNDGYWYRGLVELRPGEKITFVQGSYRPAIRAEFDALVKRLADCAPHVEALELEG